jgi:hypothetical protein
MEIVAEDLGIVIDKAAQFIIAPHMDVAYLFDESWNYLLSNLVVRPAF